MAYLWMLIGAGAIIYIVLQLKKWLKYDNTEGLSTEEEPKGLQIVREEKIEEDDENE